MAKLADKRLHLLVLLLLIVVTLLAYCRILGADFINFDDDQYVSENRFLYLGISLDGLRWALTSTMAATWQPMVWLSFLIDWQIYEMNPLGFHLTNLLLHLANTLILYLILRQMTGKLWQSAFVAALFAVHPLHVESVAWITERKDVLSTLFWMLSLWAYIHYAASRKPIWYILVTVFFVLGLMSKPMLVTLPFTLLLLDYWPLNRLKLGLKKLILEKIPLFALSAASTVITFWVQDKFGAVTPFTQLSLGIRAANAAVAYMAYIGKMFWPRGLAIFYPHPGATLPEWQVAGAVVLLVLISTLAFVVRRTRPYFTMGWLWYLGTLIPTIGLVQFGAHGMADRFTYIPLIGLFILIAWSMPLTSPKHTRYVGALAAAVVVVLVYCTWIQTGYWQNSIRLYEHALKVTKNNHVAHNNLGTAYLDAGEYQKAILQYEKALEIDVGNPELFANIGLALARQGDLTEAISCYKQAIKINPNLAGTWFNLGLALADQGDYKGAVREYRRAIRLQPDLPGPHYQLGAITASRGMLDEGIRELEEAVRLCPNMGIAHRDLALAYFFKERYADAWREVHLAKKYRANGPSKLFIKDLSEKMPDPRPSK